MTRSLAVGDTRFEPVMIGELDGTSKLFGTSGSLLDEALAGVVGDTGFEPVSPA